MNLVKIELVHVYSLQEEFIPRHYASGTLRGGLGEDRREGRVTAGEDVRVG